MKMRDFCRLVLLNLMLLTLICCYWLYVVYATSNKSVEVSEPWSNSDSDREFLNCTKVNVNDVDVNANPSDITVNDSEDEEELRVLVHANCTRTRTLPLPSPTTPRHEPHKPDWQVGSAASGTMIILWIGFATLNYNLSAKQIPSRGCVMMGGWFRVCWWSLHSWGFVVLIWLFLANYETIIEIWIVALLSLITFIVSMHWVNVLRRSSLMQVPVDEEAVDAAAGQGVEAVANADQYAYAYVHPPAPALGHAYWARFVQKQNQHQQRENGNSRGRL